MRQEPNAVPEVSAAKRHVGSFCPSLAASLGVASCCHIRWAHGVNSRQRLRRALRDDRVQMLEIDISFGELRASNSQADAGESALAQKSLVAAHYPTQQSSDLSVEEFLRTVMQHNVSGSCPKGIKLDFKQLDCVTPTVAVLLHLHTQLATPGGPPARAGWPRGRLLPAVFFNADVVRGSCLLPQITERLQEPLPLVEFVQRVVSALAFSPPRPDRLACALSLGWTPGVPISSGCRLTEAMADEMLKGMPLVRAACQSGLLQHVTFGVSAACARDSEEALSRVRAAVADSVDMSVTFFTPTFGLGLKADEVAYLHQYPACPKDHLFLDLRRRPATLDLQRALSRCFPRALRSDAEEAGELREDQPLAMGKVAVC